jgi:hypothetical protein
VSAVIVTVSGAVELASVVFSAVSEAVVEALRVGFGFNNSDVQCDNSFTSRNPSISEEKKERKTMKRHKYAQNNQNKEEI